MSHDQVSQSSNTGDISQLSIFFPSEPSLWYYSGTGNYKHYLKTDQMIYSDRRIDYKLQGEVKTDEKGISYNDLIIKIRYVITPKGLRQEITGDYLLDSTFRSLYLIQFPIKPGHFWYENVIDHHGNKYKVKTEIIDESFIDHHRIITLRTDDLRSDYFEIRKIQEDTGIIAFEKNESINGTFFKVGYTLDYIETEVESIQDISKGYAISFLNQYNKAWQKFYNKEDGSIFNYYLDSETVKETYRDFERAENTTISFKSLSVNSMTLNEDDIVVEVEESFDIYHEGIKSSQKLNRQYHLVLDNNNKLKINHIVD